MHRSGFYAKAKKLILPNPNIRVYQAKHVHKDVYTYLLQVQGKTGPESIFKQSTEPVLKASIPFPRFIIPYSQGQGFCCPHNHDKLPPPRYRSVNQVAL